MCDRYLLALCVKSAFFFRFGHTNGVINSSGCAKQAVGTKGSKISRVCLRI